MNEEINNVNSVVNNTAEILNTDTVNLVKETASSGWGIGTIILVVVGVFLLWVIWVYNTLVQLRIKVEEAWANIEVQLKRRYDLIPNLIDTVKGYVKHERETLDAVVTARGKATKIDINAKDITPEQMIAFSSAQEGLTGALGNLFALAENYPDLKANTNFIELQRALEDTEDKIESSRAGFNNAVAVYNMKVEMFPGNIIAGIFKFIKKEMFEVENAIERKVVKVDFS